MAETRMKWLMPGRIIYAQDRTADLDGVKASVDFALQMMESSEAATIHHIIDQRHQPAQAEDIDINTANRELSRMLTHPKTGWILTCYGSNMYMQYVNWVLAHENQARSKHFETAQEALAFLYEVDDSLGDMPDVENFLKDFE